MPNKYVSTGHSSPMKHLPQRLLPTKTLPLPDASGKSPVNPQAATRDTRAVVRSVPVSQAAIKLAEPPDADPHAGWFGAGSRSNPGPYPDHGSARIR